MADHAFSVALNRRFTAAQRAGAMSRKQVITAVALKTNYDAASIKRHLGGETIPRTRERAMTYARAFGEGEDGELMGAYALSRAERDVTDVKAHLGKIAGTAALIIAALALGMCAGAPGSCRVLQLADTVVDSVGGDHIGL